MSTVAYTWPPEAETILRAEWGSTSASRIIEMLPPDVNGTLPSRSAVCGKANRVGLSGTKDRPRKPRPPRVRQRKPREPFVVPDDPHPVVMRHLALHDLKQGQCRFPLGPRAAVATHFCGNDVAEGKAWCPHHCGRAFQPEQPKSYRPRPLVDIPFLPPLQAEKA